MVAIIKSGYSIHRIVNYNENKVKQGVAKCIGGGNSPLDPERTSMTNRLNLLLKRTELNQRAKRTSVHISLNFHPSEKSLKPEKLMRIAESYMQQIGFGQQPFLVYQHLDAGHPHIHIVTTNVQANGKTIDMHLIGARKSEPARKFIEKSFGLVTAEVHGNRIAYRPEAVGARQVSYGKSETKKAIQNVLEHTVSTYKYTSLPELNAVLGRYNVMAQRGDEGSRVNRHGGLLYRVLDAQGNPVGVPIKASAFYSKPTLENLAKLFVKNASARTWHKPRVKNLVEMALNRHKGSLQGFVDELAGQGIDAVLRKNEDGFLFGITYVDHVTKCVFNGSALGKPYSAKRIRERCGVPLVDAVVEKKQAIDNGVENQVGVDRAVSPSTPISNGTFGLLVLELFEQLTEQEYVPEQVPYELSMRKKKRRRKKKSGSH